MSGGRRMAWLAELDLLDPEDELVTLHFSDIPVRPFPSDDPDKPGQRYDPRMLEAPSMALDVFSDAARLAGNIGTGQLVLSNADGALNGFRGWVFKAVRVWWGDPAQRSFGAFRQMLAGRAEAPRWSTGAGTPGSLAVPIYDARLDLEQDLQPASFAGTNSGTAGYEGTADDLKGRPKPLALGDLTAANIPLIWVNPEAQAGQMHDGEIQELTYLADRGADANLIDDGDLSGGSFDSATPSVGHQVTDLGRGLVKVNQDFGGDITFGCKGAVDLVASAGYLDTAVPLIEALIKRLDPAATISASFAALAATETAKVGFYAAERMPVRTPVEALARSLPGWVLPGPLGDWRIGKLRLPTGSPLRTIRPVDVISITPGDSEVSVPAWRVVVRGRRIYRTHERRSLAESLHDTAEEARLREEWREAVVEDTELRDRWWPNVREVTIDTVLIDQADMEAVATLLASVMGLRPDGLPWVDYTVTMEMDEEWLDLVDDPGLGIAEVRLIYPEEGVDRDMIILGARPGRPAGNQITLRLWG